MWCAFFSSLSYVLPLSYARTHDFFSSLLLHNQSEGPKWKVCVVSVSVSQELGDSLAQWPWFMVPCDNKMAVRAAILSEGSARAGRSHL